jgi:hypothetical protein
MSQQVCQRRDPVELLLKGILHSALFYAGALTLAGCADAEKPRNGPESLDDGGADDAGEAEPTTECVQRIWVDAAGLVPAEAHDYLAIRRIDQDNSSDAGAAWSLQSKVGEPCATASDKPACTAALKAEPSDCLPILFSMIGCSELSAVTTDGDDVKRWAGPDESLALLGEIDSPAEAELLAILAGYAVCGNQATREKDRAYQVHGARVSGCPSMITGYVLRVDPKGAIEELSSKVLSTGGACAGRMPGGLCSEAADRGRDALGDLLARVAHLEAASVFAFERLARELSAHGAPSHLIEAAFAARADEVAHARSVSALACARGGEPVEARVLPFAVRTLEEVACENAVEGCVRETYGALVGAHQALKAEDPELRRAMQTIADDEARHAALSHRVDAWIMEQLDAPARERVRAAKRDAVRELCAASLDAEVSELEQRAGFPSPQVARSMVAKLARTLWAGALGTPASLPTWS